ncbi:MAG: hypothetical protein NTV97_05850 [Alphaproteobacteria bacterium]|nr:hypothetical protein [Alphaproteobacteria bacterium]
MSIVGHRRRLERLELRSGSKSDPWVEAVYAVERKVQATRKAVAALVELALVLAGTDKMPMQVRRETPPPAPAATPQIESFQPVAAGSTEDRNSSAYIRPWTQPVLYVPPPVDPGRPREPWENWGFERLPSYDGETD